VRLRKLGLIETLEYPVPGKEDLTCCVCYKTRSSAQHAVKTLNHKSLNGQLLEVKLLSKDIKPTKKSSLKKSRVIVRNISFKCTEEELSELFTSHGGGTVISVDIPKNSNNKPLGYGFVQLLSYLEAQEAINKVNGTTFKGRPIAVDWVISRDNYKRYMEALNEEENDEEREKESGDQEMNDDEERGEMEGEESDEGELFDKEEEGESDDDDDDGGQIESDISNEQERFDNGSDDEDNSKASIRTEPTKVKNKPSDVHEGKTLFVRNIPFDADEEELSDVFRHYGSIKYCKLVVDQETKLCKGTGFVQYKEIGSVNKCIESASSDEGIVYRQDRLNVVVALSKEELSRKKKIEEEERSSQKDKRNLYLLDEGC
jgi:nucleolar protein 4